MNFFITGGAGFIGSHLIEALLKKSHQVVCLDDCNDYYNPAVKRNNIQAHSHNSNFKLIEGDVRHSALLENIFLKNNFDCIVHLAARAGVRQSIYYPKLYADVNILGTLNVLECAKKYKVKKFIFASSSSVYGNNKKVPFLEIDPVDFPISPYAATKKAGELLCYNYHHLYGISIACLRFFTVYGPRQRPEMAIHSFIRSIARDETITMYGDGITSRDYTYVDDIVLGILLSIEKELGYEIFNLGNSYPVRLIDLIHMIEKYSGKSSKIEKKPLQPGDVEKTFAGIEKAKNLLGWKPEVGIEEGIQRTVEWHRKEIFNY